jgi:hypothetical protein
MLLLRYIMGLPKETSLDDQSSTNPVDRQFLSFVWRKLRKPPERWGPALARVSASL